MKKYLMPLSLLLSVSLHAQSAPPSTPQAPQQPAAIPQAALQQAQSLQRRITDDTMQLKGLAVFQDFIEAQGQWEQLQQQYASSKQAPVGGTISPKQVPPAQR